MRAIPTGVSSPFRITSDGTRLFYPWYNFGPCYEVPSDALRESIQRYRAVSTVIGIVAIGFAAFAWRAELDQVWRILSLAVVLAVFAHYNVKVRDWTHGLKKSDTRIDTAAERKAYAAEQHPIKLLFMGILGMSLAALGIFVGNDALASRDIGFALLGGFILLLGAAFSIVTLWLLKLGREAKREDQASRKSLYG